MSLNSHAKFSFSDDDEDNDSLGSALSDYNGTFDGLYYFMLGNLLLFLR